MGGWLTLDPAPSDLKEETESIALSWVNGCRPRCLRDVNTVDTTIIANTVALVKNLDGCLLLRYDHGQSSAPGAHYEPADQSNHFPRLRHSRRCG